MLLWKRCSLRNMYMWIDNEKYSGKFIFRCKQSKQLCAYSNNRTSIKTFPDRYNQKLHYIYLAHNIKLVFSQGVLMKEFMESTVGVGGCLQDHRQ